MTRFLVLAVILAIGPAELAAQNSIFGTRGLGFPGRRAGVRSLSLGGAAALFDPSSPENPALPALYNQITVGLAAGTTFRKFTAAGVDQSGLRETRFPQSFVGGRIGSFPLGFQFGFSPFAERTFDLRTEDSVTVNGDDLVAFDQRSSDGGVVDMRGALAWRVTPNFNLGAAVHVFAGSSRLRAVREFSDSTVLTFEEVDNLSFSANGVSFGAVWWAHPNLHIAATGRANTSLTSRLDDGSSIATAMPYAGSAGVSIGVTSDIRIYSAATYTQWSRARDELAIDGTRTFDTWEASTGLALGASREKFPIRLGIRYAQLPFSPGDEQPTEWNYSVGTGTRFASNRAVIDFALMRFRREGAGAEETGWYGLIGITVSPSR